MKTFHLKNLHPSPRERNDRVKFSPKENKNQMDFIKPWQFGLGKTSKTIHSQKTELKPPICNHYF